MKRKQVYIMLTVLCVIALLVVSTVLAAPKPKPACRDKIDNDGDGLTDLEDPGCANRQDTSELDPNVECDDGIDNDGDGNIDTADSGCSGPTGTDETDCGDGICEGGETYLSCSTDCTPPDTCSDTDGGNIPAIFGTTSGFYDGTPYSSDDYCVDSSNIMEHYCSGDYKQSSQQSCGTDSLGTAYCSNDDVYQDSTDYFCASGACDSTTTPQLQEDCGTDGWGSAYCNGDSSYIDYTDNFCASGACDSTITPNLIVDCNSLDSESDNYCMFGDVYKEVIDAWCASETGYCQNSTTMTLVEDCTGAEVCDQGQCVIFDSCGESDGGFAPLVPGYTMGYLNQTFYNHTDYCVSGTTLKEYYCAGSYEYNFDTNCVTNTTTGCNAGACI